MKIPVAVVALLVAVFAAAGVWVVQGDSDRPVTPAPKVEQPTQKADTDLTSDLRSETGISAADEAANERLAATSEPDAAPDSAGKTTRANAPPCTVDYSGSVWSDRAPGVRPSMFVLHYTVSANRPGWGDVRAIQSYFKSSRVASSHFIVDFEGNCLKMVPGAKKAWTQGNANSWSYSVEIIATGRESAAQWRASPLIRKKILANLVVSVMRAHKLPIRRVDPVGCVFPQGWTDHNHLECGNFHFDVSPHFPFRVFKRQLASLR